MDTLLTDRGRGSGDRWAPWLLALLVAFGGLGTELRGQSSLDRECPATLTLQTSPAFDDPAESLRYEWRDGRGTVLGRESRLTVELLVGTHTHVSVVTAPDGRTARDEITVVVTDTRPPTLGVGRRRLDLPASAAGDADVDLVAAMRVTSDDACDPDPPAITWDPPPPYTAGDTEVTFTATDLAGNRTSTQARVRVAPAASRPSPATPTGGGSRSDASGPAAATRASERPASSSAPPGRETTAAPPPTGSGPIAGNSGTPARTATGSDVRVSGGPASTAGGLAPVDAVAGVASAEPGASAAAPRVTSPPAQGASPAVFGVGIPASGLRWGGVALGVGMLLVAWRLVTRRRARSAPTSAPTPVVFLAVAKPNTDAVHTIRPAYVPPRYRLDLRPHMASGTHTVVRSGMTPSPREEP